MQKKFRWWTQRAIDRVGVENLLVAYMYLSRAGINDGGRTGSSNHYSECADAIHYKSGGGRGGRATLDVLMYEHTTTYRTVGWDNL